MAYAVKYRFQFDSKTGTPFRIDIAKDGYSGAILSRAVGGSPVLRRSKSDNICGTSLEIPAECLVDGEYEEFKTSTPFTFKVQLYGGSDYGTLIWAGFVTPEMMSAPDIAPAYDVQVSCTDGLGELKYIPYPARGGYSLEAHLQYLLGLTNLGLPVEMVNDLRHSSYSASQLLSETGIDLDFLKDKSCYDVLQSILIALHATITQHNGAWLVFRETGASIVSRAGAAPYIPTSSSRAITVDNFGSEATHSDGWWPVGNMTHSNEPARKRMVLTAENHYVENILSDALWTAVSGGVDSGDFWTLASAGAGMKQTHTFSQQVSKKLLLSIKVRNVGSGADPGKLAVKVKAIGTSYAGSRTFYLANGSYGRRNAQTDFSWSTNETTCIVEVQAPAAEDTDEDYVNIGIVLPLYRNTARDYFYATSLEITVSNSEGTYEQRVYGISLSKYERFSGFRKIVELGNGARGDGPDVDLAFAAITGGNLYAGAEEMMLGVPVDATSLEKISTWYSSKFEAGLDYLSLMARDYALSVAEARTWLRGTLNVPVGRARIPVCFKDDYTGVYYFIETFSWDLFTDDLSVEMLSRPVASISVADETIEEEASDNPNGHSQSESSSSGGGGGGGGGTGTVTSVGLSMPDAFSVTGSPVTGAGTIAVTLKSGYTIPSTTLINRIPTATQTQHWETAYQQTHTHSNKTVLDGITAAKVAQWDTAAGGGMTASDLGLPAPTVKITKTSSTSYIRVWHPLIWSVSGAEIVLMTKSRKARSKHGTSRTESSNAHYPRKGWMVARSYNGSRTFTFYVPHYSICTDDALVNLQNYIIRYYTRVGDRTRAQMASMSYAAWRTYTDAHFGWARTKTGSKGRNRRMFGVAVRIPNPAWDRVVNTQQNLSEHTQCLSDAHGNPVPRYLYSAVAPLLAQIVIGSDDYRSLGFEVR